MQVHKPSWACILQKMLKVAYQPLFQLYLQGQTWKCSQHSLYLHPALIDPHTPSLWPLYLPFSKQLCQFKNASVDINVSLNINFSFSFPRICWFKSLIIDWTLSFLQSLDFSYFVPKHDAFFCTLPLLPMPYLNPSPVVHQEMWPVQTAIFSLIRCFCFYSIDSFAYISVVNTTQCLHCSSQLWWKVFPIFLQCTYFLKTSFNFSSFSNPFFVSSQKVSRVTFFLMNLLFLEAQILLSLFFSAFLASCKWS